MFSEEILNARVAELLAKHDPGSDAWRRESIELASATSVHTYMRRHRAYRRLVDLLGGWLDRERDERVSDDLTAAMEKYGNPERNELIGIYIDGAYEERSAPNAGGGPLEDYDAINHTPIMSEIVDGMWYGVLALPGEPVERWPITYTDPSEANTVIAAVDLHHLIHDSFFERGTFAGYMPEPGDRDEAGRAHAFAVIDAFAAIFGFDADAAREAWLGDYPGEYGGGSCPDWLADLEDLIIHPGEEEAA